MTKLIFFSTVILLTACYSASPEKTDLEGKSLPDFTLLLANNDNYFNTINIPKSKPFTIFYFSPYCPYCRAQTKEIIEDIDKLKNINFYLVTGFPIADMKKFYTEYKLNKYHNIIVGRDTANFVPDYFELSAVPYLAIYGKDKRLKKCFVGKIYSNQIKKAATESN